MHELSIAQEMLRIAGEKLGGPKKLKAVAVTVGSLSGVDPDALSFALPAVAESLGFGSPEMELTRVVARATCAECGTAYDMEDVFTLCPACNAMARTISGGEELSLDSVVTLEEE